MSTAEIVVVAVVTLLLVAAGLLLVGRGRRTRGAGTQGQPRPGVDYVPGVGDDASEPRDTPTRTVATVELPPPEVAPPLERPEKPAGRLVRLRARLARSQGALGRNLLDLLGRDHLDQETWDAIEDTLITSDLGVSTSHELVEGLRTQVKVEGTETPADARELLRRDLVALVDPTVDRSLNVQRKEGRPAVVLIVGVNGTGKTTTTGKLARMLVADDLDVVLGAADTFRAAAADQLQTWGDRVGVPVVRGPEGGDPASVAFDAVRTGTESEADVVVIDTAGRLHTKTGLMDELGKVKRVVEKQTSVDEVLLVIDATTGQNGLAQARVFADAVAVTGIVLTKLDGTAKGGIVVSVQRELGVPVKLVGLGEGPDDLAPFDPVVFVDALLGED